jgi:hypothetical protein
VAAADLSIVAIVIDLAQARERAMLAGDRDFTEFDSPEDKALVEALGRLVVELGSQLDVDELYELLYEVREWLSNR